LTDLIRKNLSYGVDKVDETEVTGNTFSAETYLVEFKGEI
jgi:hypothetical protein